MNVLLLFSSLALLEKSDEASTDAKCGVILTTFKKISIVLLPKKAPLYQINNRLQG